MIVDWETNERANTKRSEVDCKKANDGLRFNDELDKTRKHEGGENESLSIRYESGDSIRLDLRD